MTADEPMSTSDSGGLREAVEALAIDLEARGDHCARLSTDATTRTDAYRLAGKAEGLFIGRNLARALLAAHPEPVPTPDSVDDATAGGRECGPDCDDWPHPGHLGAADTTPPATPPDDDANRAPVSGVEALAGRWQEVLAECKAADPRWILDRSVTVLDGALDELRHALKSDRAGLAARDAAWVERLAVVEGERACGICENHVRVEALIQRSSLGSAEAKAVRESVPADIGIAIATAARHLARAEAAEAERDTARREAGERVAVAIEALSVLDDDMRRRDAETMRSRAALIARADALTSDDRSGV